LKIVFAVSSSAAKEAASLAANAQVASGKQAGSLQQG